MIREASTWVLGKYPNDLLELHIFMCSFWQNRRNIMTNLYLINLHLLTNPYDYGDKSKWHYWQIHKKIIGNSQEYHEEIVPFTPIVTYIFNITLIWMLLPYFCTGMFSKHFSSLKPIFEPQLINCFCNFVRENSVNYIKSNFHGCWN